MKKFFSILVILTAFLLCGCGIKSAAGGGERELDFTVVEKSQIPDELLTSIGKAQTKEFSMTAQIDGYLYIARGYGEQPTGGYSISADSVTETDDEIRVHTTLTGPEPGEAVNRMATYPYIVLKTEASDKNVIFQ